MISNCIPCILANRKRGKQEGLLQPMQKESLPLHTFHIDHLGPLETTNKNYKYILAIVDAFTKFVWLYPTKTTTSREVIEKLDNLSQVFGFPQNIISDRGTCFTSHEFDEYCIGNDINHHKITAGLPRANGQVERVNGIIIPILTKLALGEAGKWYKHVHKVQRAINSTYQRSINTSPFELLMGTRMRNKADHQLKEMIEIEFIASFEASRDELRKRAKAQILKVQEENKRYYNLRRRTPTRYELGDIVAIKRTEYGPGLKLKPSFLGPYKVIKIKGGNTYNVSKVGVHNGPETTSTCAEYMKRWSCEEDQHQSSGADNIQDGRVWENNN